MSKEAVDSEDYLRKIRWLKKNLGTWLLVRDPHNEVKDKNHPKIVSFWDFCQCAKVTVTDEQKERVVREFFKDCEVAKSGTGGNRQ